MSEQTAHYTVLARRFRPQTFDDVVGQDRIGQALRNAIAAGRVAHAYLFTGARGVGKTSTARIFAKALNCPHVQEAVPCNECDVCQTISAGSDVDVLEIDGASNRGIDDIRSLRANVTIRSMRSPYKVYIIDEVHMLTKEAFNALLKTLEEPPPNVKFVFCTTEPNKVPDTILSRCQRFDFGTIAPTSIMARLGQIAEAEKVQVDEAALELLARRAAGSMRDSQSLFDQLLAFGSDRITADDVHQLLGTAGDDRLIGLMDAIIARRRDEALGILDHAMNEGVQIGAFSDQLLHYLRDLLITSAGADSVPLESVSESQRETLTKQAAIWGLQTVTAALEILVTMKARMQRVNYDRALLELAVIRLSLLEELDNIAALIAGVSGDSGSSASPAARPTRSPAPSSRSSAAPATPRPPSASAQPTAAMAATKPSRGVDPPIAPPAKPVSALEAEAGLETVASPNTATPPEAVAPIAPQPRDKINANAGKTLSTTPKVFVLSDSTINVFWSEVISQLPVRLVGHLEKKDGIAIPGPNSLELSFPQSYVLGRQYCERPETIQRIAEAASKVAGRPVKVSVVASQQPDNISKTKPPVPPPQAAQRKRKSDVENDPFVQQALYIFGGTVIDARELHEQAGERN